MNRLAMATWVISASLHAAVVLPFVLFASSASLEALDAGSGSDTFKIEQGIAIDSVSFGDAPERVEIAEVTPVLAAAPTPPPPDVQLTDVIAAKDSPQEPVVVAKEVPPPPEPPKPKAVAAQEVPAQVAMVTEQSSGVAQTGGSVTAYNAYKGQLFGALQRAKTNPRSGKSGVVIVRFTVDVTGKILSRAVSESSGWPVLDEAAVESLDRAEFPPLPRSLAGGPQEFTVPFLYTVR